MTGWLLAAFFFCLAGIGWWRSEQYRRLCRKNAQLAADATLALINSELSLRLVDHYNQQMARHARTFKWGER